MADKNAARRPGAPRDEGAPADQPNRHTIAAPDAPLQDVQQGVVEAGIVRSSLPADPEHEAGDPGALTAHIPATPVPTVTSADAPSGSSWTDERDQARVSTVNENAGPVPQLAYVVTWGHAAVHVTPDAAQTRRVGEGDDAREERFLTVRSATGAREAVLEGQQVTLHRGELLPEQTVEGQGAFLVTIGGAVAVSVPAAAQAGDGE